MIPILVSIDLYDSSYLDACRGALINTLYFRYVFAPLKVITLVIGGLREFPHLLFVSIELKDEVPVVDAVLCSFFDLLLPIMLEISVPVIYFCSPMIKYIM